MRISSLAGSELRSPTTIAGNDRGRHSRTNSHSARTCSWRTPLWSSRQLRCAQKTWIGPRGPAISANTASRSSPSSSAAPAPSRGSARTTWPGDGPACDHRVARAHAVRERQVGRPHRALEPELRGELLGLVVRAVVPHLLQADDVGVDALQRRTDRRCAPFPRAVARPEVPRRDAHARLDEWAVSRVVGEVGGVGHCAGAMGASPATVVRCM